MLLLRLLAFLIDCMIIFLPSTMLSYLLMVPAGVTIVLPQLLFVVYNMICLSSFEGKTIGKHFAKLVVFTNQRNILTVGMREVAKLLYFLPMIGWLFFTGSFFLYLGTKKTLHDILGQSVVGFNKKQGNDQYERNLLR
ncbi:MULTISPECIES: RDD family protein [Enterococcus]|jgi:uncharacterized RDD family membrane protein YckC|uniref:RDD domain-containing protein n=1 Tax=Enterococcus innesii TaxID=2839759 RepID=A0ABN6NPH1_9ENTE|nr:MULTISPECIES: RDD family protein [Enterococcus]MBW9323183.1 hypothetical protein [Enterococcus casseliflavus]MBK0037113.1 RDD family protein [Enterococcus sp. S52]MBK0069776.1 RDD family protein [Enterococcus sp. S53]MBK0140369.1 RDD family protein [Enterococcus sp. S76]MBK0143958.1 RDD family protein [Enterococcus sp. S77]